MSKKENNNNKELDLHRNNLKNYNDNTDDYGNSYDDNPYDNNGYQDNYNRYYYNNQKESANVYEDNQSNFAEKLYKDYIKEHHQKEINSFRSILIFLVLATFISQIVFFIYNRKYAFFDELNDSYNETIKYQFVDLERTPKTSYPYLIKKFPETKNFSR